MNERKFDDFDGFASDYRETHDKSITISGADSNYFSEHKIREIEKNEKIKEVRFLDLGCGDGNTAEYFHRHFKNSSYTGLDVSEKSIAVASERKIEGCNFSTYDGLNIPFEDDAFDIVMLACVLHHINFDNHLRLLGEAKRVLKNGGKLYIFEHNPFNPVTRKIVRSCPFDEDAVLLTHRYTKKTLDKLSFKDVSTNFILFFPRNKFFNKFLFLEDYFKSIPIGGQYYTVSTK